MKQFINLTIAHSNRTVLINVACIGAVIAGGNDPTVVTVDGVEYHVKEWFSDIYKLIEKAVS